MNYLLINGKYRTVEVQNPIYNDINTELRKINKSPL
ncbi:hypothetical protein SAMN05444338_10195 [Flavobacterium degerlachei]|uniref:Uncharacterized protein n=1 Tax=Flavobacterium degerlachei TaxID=229203 RepID=A0A1H2Q572_9FLAO|nr:hypothetical protein SAMN05444338_10195 [Flavobacterium degerlachei]